MRLGVLLKTMIKIQPLSQSQIQKLGAIPSSLGAINKIKPIQKINQPVNSTGDFVDYNDPYAVNSIADVLTQAGSDKKPTGAIYTAGVALDIAGDFVKIPGVDIALNIVGKLTKAGALIADKDFRDYIKNAYIDPALAGNWSAVGYNALQGFSETVDILAQPVKAFSSLAGGSAETGLKNLKSIAAGALGIDTGYGRANYDYNTGNLLSDMALEFVSDPMNLIDIAGGITKFGAKSSTGSDAISKFRHGRRLKVIKEATPQAAKKSARQVKSHARYIEKRAKVINTNFDKLKINKRKEFIDKWTALGKQYYPSDSNYQNPGYILNMLEGGYLDAEYNTAMQSIERARTLELNQLVEGVHGFAADTAGDEATRVVEYTAQGYVDMVNNINDPSKFNKVDLAEQKVKALEYAPAKIKNSKAWQRAYSNAKAARDKARTEVRINATQTVGADLLSEESVNRLSQMSLRPSDNPELLKGVGGAAATVIRTASTIQDAANTVDRQVIKTATGYIPSLIWRGTKFVGRNAISAVRGAWAVAKLNKPLKNATENFFSKYYTSDGFLDLSRFNQYYPEFQRFVGRTKLQYDTVIKATEDTAANALLRLPDAEAFLKKINASVDHLDAELSKIITADKQAAEQLDELLDLFNKNFKGFFTDAADLAEMAEIRKSSNIADKLELLKLYRNYIETLSTVDLDNLPKSKLDMLVNKLRNFEDHLNSLKYGQAIEHLNDITAKADFIAKSVKVYTTTSSSLRKNLYNFWQRVSNNKTADILNTTNRQLLQNITANINVLRNTVDSWWSNDSLFWDTIYNAVYEIDELLDDLSKDSDKLTRVLALQKNPPAPFLSDFLKRVRDLSNLIESTKGSLEESANGYATKILKDADGAVAASTQLKSASETIKKHIESLDIHKKVILKREDGRVYETTIADLFTNPGESMFLKPVFSKIPAGDFKKFKEAYSSVERALTNFFSETPSGDLFAAKRWLETAIYNADPEGHQHGFTKFVKTPPEKVYDPYSEPLFSIETTDAFEIDLDQFSKVYHIIGKFTDVKKTSIKDVQSIADMLSDLPALEEFIELLPANLPGVSNLRNAVASLSKHAVSIGEILNVSPELKAYQVYFSGTKAYFDFITDPAVKDFMNMLRNPSSKARNHLEELLYAFQEAADTTNGDWLKNATKLQGFFEAGSEDSVNEALKALQRASEDYQRQSVFVENIFSNNALNLTNYSDESLKQDYLKFLIVDTLNYYHDLGGSDFYDNFDEHYTEFIKRLKDNVNIRLSEHAYNLEHLKNAWLKGDYAKAAESLKNHDAAADCNITELVVKQFNSNAANENELLFAFDPSAVDVYIDTEFSVTTDLSKGAYSPLQLAYKLADSAETTDVRIKFNPEDKNKIDSRTLEFFEKAHKANLPEEEAASYKYTVDDFIAEWSKEEFPERATAFYDFFKNLRELESKGKHVRLIGHNITGAELPLLDVEFKKVRKALVDSGVFYNAIAADNWFTALKLNSVDTLTQLRLKDGVPAITTEQEEIIRTLLSDYAVASKNSSHLTRAINTTLFDSINSIKMSLQRASKKTTRSKQTAQAFTEFFETLKDYKTFLGDVLGVYKANTLSDYFFDENVFKEWDITIDGVKILNLTQFNAAVGTVSYLGFRRISTPELRHFFNDSIIAKTVYNKKYVRFVEQLYEQIDRIRYPEHLYEYTAELQKAYKELYKTITEDPKLLATPGYESWLGFFKDLKMPENPIELFVLFRKMANKYDRFLSTRNPDAIKLPVLSDELTLLISGVDPRLYRNEVIENTADVTKPLYEEVPELERINKLRKRATACCKNETQRLEEVSTYLEDTNKTGYHRFIHSKTAHIDLRIRPIAEAFSKKSPEDLQDIAEVFKTIPQNQLDNRFKRFLKADELRLVNELLYNPLHTMVIHETDLLEYGNIVSLLKEYNSVIKYKQVEELVYLYLDDATLKKYTFNKGVPYLANVPVPRPSFKDVVEDSVPEVLKMREEVTSLYELDAGYFSDSGGRTFSEKQLREIYNLLPEEVQTELPDVELLLHSGVFENGPVINNILLGNYHLRSQIIKSSIEDPITNYLMSAQYCAKDLGLRTHWLNYFFDATDGLTIALDENGSLLNNVLLDNFDFSSVSDLCAALEVNKTYTLTALIPDGEKFRVFELPVNNPAAVKKIIETRKVPVRLMTKAEALKVKNIVEQPTYNFLSKGWNMGVRIFKNAVLLSLGTFLRNAMDTFMKTAIEIGAQNTLNYSFEAHKLRREYNKVIELVADNSFTLADGSRTSGLLSEKSLDYVFAHPEMLTSRGITIDRDTFNFIRTFKDSDAAAAMHKHQEAQIRYRKAFLDSAEYKADPNLTFNSWLNQTNKLKNKLKKGKGFEKIQNGAGSLWGTYNSFLSLMITPSSYIEDVNRLAMYLKYSDEGLLTKTSIFQKIKDTHFDFNYKTNITSKIEQFIPFYNFTKENAVYWLRILEERPDVLKIISDVMTPVLDLDSYNVEELERNRGLVNAITNGYVRIDKQTNLMLKANPSFMDAFALFTNPVEAFQQGFIIDTPQSREQLLEWEGGWKDIIEQNLYNVPWVGTIAQRVESVKRNWQRLDKTQESYQTPIIRQGLNKAAATVSSTFTVPVRYRNAKYTSDQYYRRWRNYRSPVRSIYTKTGISKLQILMEPVSPDNVKYKLGVMQSFVNRQ